jgi:hypothetical protein
VTSDQSATFFDCKDKEKTKLRDELAIGVLEDCFQWLKGEGDVAIHDG